MHSKDLMQFLNGAQNLPGRKRQKKRPEENTGALSLLIHPVRVRDRHQYGLNHPGTRLSLNSRSATVWPAGRSSHLRNRNNFASVHIVDSSIDQNIARNKGGIAECLDVVSDALFQIGKRQKVYI